MVDKRLKEEIRHSAKIAENAAEVWHWEGYAGKKRWKRRVEMLTSNLNKDMNVLEVGCGIGLLTEELAQKVKYLKAVDISKTLIQKARQRLSQKNLPNLKIEVQNAYQLKEKSNSFDAIVGMSVLHHLDVDKALIEFRRVLKRGGFCVFSEPNYLNPHIFLERKVPFLRKVMGLSKYESAFVRFFLEKKLLKFGFCDINIFPYDFVYPFVKNRKIVDLMEKIGYIFENIPLLKEIAGSLYIFFRKPINDE